MQGLLLSLYSVKTYTIRSLDNASNTRSAAIELLSANCPSESDRYESSRLNQELYSIDTLPFYRRFFGAYAANNQLIAVGGIKAADWASDTHILYMMAVDKQFRGQGIGSDLEKTRLDWVRDNFTHGRCLVSTRHKKRFMRWGFAAVSEINDRHLMVIEF